MSTLFHSLPGLLRPVIGGALKLLVLAAGVVIGLSALAFGLLLTAGLLTWALLRGRKALRVQTFRWGGLSRPGPAPSADVVDIEAHEVREPGAAPRVLMDR